MITISILGIDPYLIRQISREATKTIANLYEVPEDEVNFFAYEGLLVHAGNEQNLWNVIVRVKAPDVYKNVEKAMFELLKNYLTDVCFHFTLEFEYYHLNSVYKHINDEFDLYFTEKESSYEDDEHDEDKSDEEDEVPSEEELYLGNAFKGIIDDDK